MPFPPIDKSFEGLLTDTRSRLEIVERRLGILPERISSSGRKVTDWNDAIDSGWYYGQGAANQPLSLTGVTVDYWVGETKVFWTSGGIVRITQTLERPDINNGPIVQRTFNAGSSGVWSAWEFIERGNGSQTASLGTLDLDVVTATGIYYQGTIANATAANHYPMPGVPGMLEVNRHDGGNHIMQRFTRRGDGDPEVFVRTKYTTGAWRPWASATGNPIKGTASQRGNCAMPYWTFWQDTDGSQRMYVADKSGGWRQHAGLTTVAAAAWDTTQTNLAGRTVNLTLPTVLEASESLVVTAAGVGSGFGFVSLSSMTRNPTNTTVAVRLMQIMSLVTQSFTLAWHILPAT